MRQRQLDMPDFRAVIAEVQRLQRDGYDCAGNWNLCQACDHLTYFIEASLDGPKFRTPWLLKVLLGRMVLRRILRSRRMKSGAPTPQKPLPPADGDVATAVSRLERAIQRLEGHAGEFHDSPFFGHLTPQQWRELHLIHCNHHLGYLVPRVAS